MMLSILRMVAMVLGPLMVVGLVALILRRGRRSALPPTITVSTPAARALEDLNGRALAGTLGDAKALAREDEEKDSHLREELTAIANTEPAMVAQLIRTWLQEDRKS